MKRYFFAATLCAIAYALPAFAQVVAPAPPAPVSLSDYYDQWTPRQWHALQTQLLTSLRAPVEEIDHGVLRNVTYFATHYPDAMELDRAAPRLLRIYQRHPEAPVRILAISALHAVSEPETMARLARLIPHEESAVARHVGIAAVSDFYRTCTGN